jgi:hypothetical protein
MRPQMRSQTNVKIYTLCVIAMNTSYCHPEGFSPKDLMRSFAFSQDDMERFVHYLLISTFPPVYDPSS